MEGSSTKVADRRAYRGPAFLEHGFRPFFLLAGLWSALGMALWVASLSGAFVAPSAFSAAAWHAHEMLFGFAAAALAGFALTAVPNWTGRLPVCGARLGLLAALWAVGRIAVALSDILGPALAALLDVAFIVVLAGTLLREIAAGSNWRNLPLIGILAALVAANVLTHLEAAGAADTGAAGLRLAIAAFAMLIALMGGRITPSFTRNWLVKRGATAFPAPFGPIDRLALGTTALAGLSWAGAPDWAVTGGLALLAALAQAVRLARWRGLATLAEPLVAILHLAYAWLTVGFALIALSVLSGVVAQTAGLHALSAGAVGTMIAAVMTRASLGHTGRTLTAGVGTAAVYALVTAAAVLRVLAALGAAGQTVLLALAAAAWIAAFALFAALYGPMLVRPRMRSGA